jgi:hypothetical protein
MKSWAQLGMVVLLGLSAAGGATPALSVSPPNEQVDIGSGGAPSLTGSLGGSITGGSSLVQDLLVTVDFGELSPINTNSITKAVIPVSVRSSGDYAVTVSVVGATGGDPNSVQLSDIGFGVGNLQPIGPKASSCGINSVFNPLFNSNPSTTVSTNSAGRATYVSSVANIGASAVILSGPQLSKNGAIKPRGNNGYTFDVVLTVVPQFFTPGNFTLTLNFVIRSTCDSCGC